jgi:hypothetical protein
VSFTEFRRQYPHEWPFTRMDWPAPSEALKSSTAALRSFSLNWWSLRKGLAMISPSGGGWGGAPVPSSSPPGSPAARLLQNRLKMFIPFNKIFYLLNCVFSGEKQSTPYSSASHPQYIFGGLFTNVWKQVIILTQLTLRNTWTPFSSPSDGSALRLTSPRGLKKIWLMKKFFLFT